MNGSLFAGQEPAQGLYDPAHEHDACGVGFVVDIKGRKSHGIVRQALSVLINLLHRGACGSEPNTGDGAGILLQIPDKFFRRECRRLGIVLPAATEYGTGLVFLPPDTQRADRVRALIQTLIVDEGQRCLGWREVPTDDRLLGETARSVEPRIMQVFVGRGAAVRDGRRRRLGSRTRVGLSIEAEFRFDSGVVAQVAVEPDQQIARRLDGRPEFVKRR